MQIFLAGHLWDFLMAEEWGMLRSPSKLFQVVLIILVLQLKSCLPEFQGNGCELWTAVGYNEALMTGQGLSKAAVRGC